MPKKEKNLALKQLLKIMKNLKRKENAFLSSNKENR